MPTQEPFQTQGGLAQALAVGAMHLGRASGDSGLGDRGPAGDCSLLSPPASASMPGHLLGK